MKRVLLSAAITLGVLVVGTAIYLNGPLGKLPDGERLQFIQVSPNYRDGAFRNEVASPPRPGGFAFIWRVIKGRFEPRDRPAPPAPLPSVKTDLAAIPRDQDTVVWLGHSSYFVQIAGKRMLIDPVFSNYAAPLPFMVRAFDGTSPYTVEDMPEIDFILITHDHYDHLDYATMKGMRDKTKLVLTGLGNGAHLEHWGYPASKIREAVWNSSAQVAPGLFVHAMPAQHYSGRFMQRNQSLWASFVIESAQRRLYFSGDTGFGPHFAAIGKRFGNFDLVALDAGQYNAKWADIHMTPEEAARAADLLGARTLLAGHAGRFTLARHAWDEPFRRSVEASQGRGYKLLTPRIGEPAKLGQLDQQFAQWWKDVK